MPKRKKLEDERPELPFQPQVGDRIKLKEAWRAKYEEDCARAGFAPFSTTAIRVVLREDPYLPGGGRRLFVDGPPHCFNPQHVELAWNSEDERREALRAQGWAV